ncbi:MAG: alpha-ketoacid dehydrogenase subunit beta [Pseudonocardia sp.]
MAELTYRHAVAAAIAQEMRRDERVVLLGEDVASGGVFKTTVGLLDEFGPARVRNTPISETAIAGAAMGAAMAGLRPIAEIMFSDFYGVCWDQVAVEIAKARYMTGGQFALPLVIRGANGGGLGFGAQHSQAVENWALCVPGLKIVSPATPADTIGLIAAAIRDDDPVLVFEHKALYAAKGEVPDGEHVLPLGQAAVLRGGGADGSGADGSAADGGAAGGGGAGGSAAGGSADVTLVALSVTVGMALKAADELAADGIAAEVLDLRTLVPLDAAAVLASVRRTGRVVIVEENPGQLGWGAAIAAIIAEEAFEELDAPVVRVSGGNIPLPVAAPLEAEVSASAARVVAAVHRQLDAPRRAPVG